MPRTVLIAGVAGFTCAGLSQRIQQQAERVVGFDNLNDNYNPSFKKARLLQIEAVDPSGALLFVRLVLEDCDLLMALIAEEKPTVVVNLAAQTGNRYLLEKSTLYVQSDWVGLNPPHPSTPV